MRFFSLAVLPATRTDWLADPIVTPEVFAQLIIDAYGLPSSYHMTIAKSIEEQLSDHKLHSATLGDISNDMDIGEPVNSAGTLVCGMLDSEDEL